MIHAVRFNEEVFAKITGENGNGPIKTFTHKARRPIITLFLVLFNAPSRRYIPGQKFRPHMRRWQQITPSTL